MKKKVSVELGTFSRTYPQQSSIRRHEGIDGEEEAPLHGVAVDFTETDLGSVGFKDWKDLLDRLIRDADSNKHFLRKLKNRMDMYIFLSINSRKHGSVLFKNGYFICCPFFIIA